jgi:hypothetical protein
MGCCGVACGQLEPSINAQGMSSVLPGSSPAADTGRLRSPQHLPVCTQAGCPFAQVIHRIVHRRRVGGLLACSQAAAGHRQARPRIPAAMTRDSRAGRSRSPGAPAGPIGPAGGFAYPLPVAGTGDGSDPLQGMGVSDPGTEHVLRGGVSSRPGLSDGAREGSEGRCWPFD